MELGINLNELKKDMGINATKKLGYSIIVICCSLIALITALAGFHPNPFNSYYLIYAAIIIIPLLVINLLLAFYWGIKHKFIAFFHLLAIVLNIGFITSMIQFRFLDEEPFDLKIATYNVHSVQNDYDGFTARRIAELMKEEKVDIICFQEFSGNKPFNLDSLKTVFKEYKYRIVPKHKNGGTDLAIFSKFPLSNAIFYPFHLSYNSAMGCDVEYKPGKKLTLYNLHLQTTNLNYDIANKKHLGLDSEQLMIKIKNNLLENEKKRTLQSLYLMNKMSATNNPIIVAGDFNAQPSSYVYEIFSSYLTDEFKRCGAGYESTYNHLGGILRIDYIFTRNGIEGTKYYSRKEDYSDHNPVFLEMNIVE